MSSPNGTLTITWKVQPSSGQLATMPLVVSDVTREQADFFTIAIAEGKKFARIWSDNTGSVSVCADEVRSTIWLPNKEIA